MQEENQYDHFIPMYPKNKFNKGNFYPHIIYNFHYTNNSFPKEINYFSNIYKLGGIYLQINQQKIILLKHEIQSLWINLEKDKYEKSIDSYLNKTKSHSLISFIYYPQTIMNLMIYLWNYS